MKFTLQELLEQKALHEKHLELINSRIAELQAREAQTPPEPATAPLSHPAAPAENTAPQLAPATPFTPPPEPEDNTGKVESGHPPLSDFPLDRSMSAADAKRGCVIWTVGLVVVSALILIAIYILYPDDRGQESAPTPEKEAYRSPYAN